MDNEQFFKDRKKSRRNETKQPNAFCDEFAAAEFPLLHDFLTLTKVDGISRKLGKLIIFAEDNRLKVCLKDAEEGEVLFLTVECYETLWSDCDAALRAPDADWRKSRR